MYWRIPVVRGASKFIDIILCWSSDIACNMHPWCLVFFKWRNLFCLFVHFVVIVFAVGFFFFFFFCQVKSLSYVLAHVIHLMWHMLLTFALTCAWCCPPSESLGVFGDSSRFTREIHVQRCSLILLASHTDSNPRSWQLSLMLSSHLLGGLPLGLRPSMLHSRAILVTWCLTFWIHARSIGAACVVFFVQWRFHSWFVLWW